MIRNDIKKLHRVIFDGIRALEAEGPQRTAKLPRSWSCRFSNALFSWTPNMDNIIKLIGATGGETLKNHNAFAGMSLTTKRTKWATSHLRPAPEGETHEPIIADFGERRLFPAFLTWRNRASLSRGVWTLLDVNTNSCDDKCAVYSTNACSKSSVTTTTEHANRTRAGLTSERRWSLRQNPHSRQWSLQQWER